tara:strand:- start:278 stop:955 length:678 start_codon:yes stop_codon:yes gene_type:complete
MKVISYTQLVIKENGKQIQKGMNYGIQKTYSVVLMSTQKNAPYNDHILEEGVIEYEGHDVPSNLNPDKKLVDQSLLTPSGTPTENGKFFQAALDYKEGIKEPSQVQVYRKLRKGIWVDMGFYDLIDAYEKQDLERKVFKFLLKPKIELNENDQEYLDLLHDRQIPGEVQKEVYERDRGKCVKCGSTENLHFDHILPFSKGGSSKVAKNIQLLCARHNLKKGAKFV